MCICDGDEDLRDMVDSVVGWLGLRLCLYCPGWWADLRYLVRGGDRDVYSIVGCWCVRYWRGWSGAVCAVAVDELAP
eukprot:6157218-Prorocentrum_lima.AAC.1